MGTFNSILVPIDGSANAKRVLLYAGYVAQLSKASVGILHVINIPKMLPVFDHIHTGVYIPNSVVEDALEAGRGIVEDALAHLPPDVKAESFIETGLPTDVIVDFCREHNYDLIIIGTRGLGKFQEFMVGSVSKYVVSHASCPVMVVK